MTATHTFPLISSFISLKSPLWDGAVAVAVAAAHPGGSCIHQMPGREPPTALAVCRAAGSVPSICGRPRRRTHLRPATRWGHRPLYTAAGRDLVPRGGVSCGRHPRLPCRHRYRSKSPPPHIACVTWSVPPPPWQRCRHRHRHRDPGPCLRHRHRDPGPCHRHRHRHPGPCLRHRHCDLGPCLRHRRVTSMTRSCVPCDGAVSRSCELCLVPSGDRAVTRGMHMEM